MYWHVKQMTVGQAGKILIRGPQVMLGFQNNPEATAAVIDNEGFFDTGIPYPYCLTSKYNTTVITVIHPGMYYLLYPFRGGKRTATFSPSSFRFGSVRFGSVRFGSVRFGSVRFGSVRFDAVRFGSVRFGSARFRRNPTEP